MKAHRRLVKYLLSHKGITVTVLDGEVEDSRDPGKIIEDIESFAGSAEIFVNHPAAIYPKQEWAMIITGTEDDETVADFSPGGLIDRWFDAGGNEREVEGGE